MIVYCDVLGLLFEIDKELSIICLNPNIERYWLFNSSMFTFCFRDNLGTHVKAVKQLYDKSEHIKPNAYISLSIFYNMYASFFAGNLKTHIKRHHHQEMIMRMKGSPRRITITAASSIGPVLEGNKIITGTNGFL